MRSASAPKATYQDILNAPPHCVAEILAGALHTSPRPAMPHATSCSVLGMDIGGAFQRGRGGSGGWWILFEPEVHLADDILVPDLAGWRREGMPGSPQGAFTELAPDWVSKYCRPPLRALTAC